MRLATFNILHGRSPADDRVDLTRYAEAVRRLDADVLALQEVDVDQPRSLGADLTALAADAMGAVEHRFVAALSGTPGATWMAATGEEQPGSASYGIALLSRYPVRSWEIVRLPTLPTKLPVVFPGRRRPQLVGDEPRVAVAALVETPYGEITVAGTHLSFIPRWNVRQLRALLKTLRSAPQPVVLMGDLNMGPEQARRVTQMRSLVDALTYPAHDPTQQLDHILAQGPLPPVVVGTAAELPLSDHRALSVDLQEADEGWRAGVQAAS